MYELGRQVLRLLGNFRWKRWCLFISGVTLVKLAGKAEGLSTYGESTALVVTMYFFLGVLCLVVCMDQE